MTARSATSTGPGSSGALEAAGCRVELALNYEFTTHVLDKVIGPVFGHIAHSFIDAFVRRAEEVYGQGQQAQR